MRDGMKTCQHTLTDDVIYKEVVVIGNGPSGLVTSFMLAGNVPYLKEIPEDLPIDEMLKARLSNLPPGQNLYETDLLELADGLEGRSQNPIPLLIEHVVLGRGAPGGSWHTFPPDVRTLSPAAWLTLPPHCGGSTERLSARAVAAYCRRYVHSCHLQNILVVGSGVSAADAVRMSLAAGFNVLHAHRAPAESLAKLSPLTYPDYCRVYKMMCDGPSAKHPNYTPYPDHAIVDVSHLDPQETPPKLTHHLDDDIRPKRVKLLNLVTNQTTELTVFIIAVFIGSKPDLFFLQTNFDINNMDVKKCKCHEKKIDDSKCFFKNHWHYFKSVLGQSIQSCKSRYLNYTEINGNIDTKCELPDCQNRDNCTCETKAKNGLAVKECKCEVIPYSNFTRENTCQCQTANPYSSGLGFGVDPKKPVDGRSNPVAIDKSTHEMLNAPKGMYALGPLTADNFIRFIPGGALAIVSQIHKEIKAEQ
ncbi:unnamed protein product [Leptidea sinapis]|uniref:FAD/NAD(P)-binding domain-containing protein n=1 Tax=Leptidea sinapis TaxID=189913 RepID=A0A5E4QGB0_9NEOP|nr:unnamed protein product [Leptidea sinapis]